MKIYQLFILAVVLLNGFTSTADEVKKNVLFILSDDQRADTIGALGNKHIKTPNLDKLVHEGTAFTNAYIMGASCPAVCMPSRAMLLTGRTLWNIEQWGAWWFEISNKYRTLPQVFRSAGYDTFQSGKWHQGEGSFKRSFESAKSAWFGGTGDHFRMVTSDYDQSTPLRNGKERVAEQKSLKDGPRLKHSSERFADGTIAYLKNRERDKPFFIYHAFFAPHDMRIAPQEFHDMYPKETIPLPANYLPEHPFDNGDMKIRDERLAGWPREKEVVQQHIADYYALITHMDEQLGRIIDTLKETGQYENTIIVFTSDNGLAVGSHGLLGKQNLYEHGVKIPMVFSGPGIPKGEIRDQFCYLLDMYPTLCDMAALKIPEEVEGKSFTHIFTDTTASIRDKLYFSYMGVQRAVRDDRYKLIEYRVKGKRTVQLFDLEKDPLETVDLAQNIEYKSKVEEMRASLVKMKYEYNDDKKLGKQFWGVED